MANLERIVAEMHAAIEALRARDASLTRIERLKLASLLLNLERVLAAQSARETCRETSGDDAGDCHCGRCELP